MNPSDCRREYKNFCAASEQARYEHFNDSTDTTSHFDELNERYADLWTRAGVKDIAHALRETSTGFVSEYDALHALAGRLRLGFCQAQGRAIADELKICEKSSRIAWRGEKITTRRAPLLLATYTDANDRGELVARMYDAHTSCDDLRAELIKVHRQSARELGFDGVCDSIEDIAGQNFAQLAAAGTTFLERTSSKYSSALAVWANETFDAQTARHLTHAETFTLERAAHLDPYLKADKSLALYRATLSEFGIRSEQQKIEWCKSSAETLETRGAVCCNVNPPVDVRVVFETQHGAQSAIRFFDAAGRAQHSAWTSRDLAARHPEFVHPPDRTTQFAFAALFENFLQDETWLAAHLGIKILEAQRIARFVALRKLFELRRACASLQFALMLDAANDPRDLQLAEAFATLHTEATYFQYSPALYLHDAPNALESSTTKLRAHLFCAALRERFRTRYGSSWWQARGARDALIDMWNTGSRYRVEELAQLNDIGELSFDLLTDSFNEDLRDD
ncbi:MAG: hypothetical protein NVSMB56_18460 [Pyrinomonadaceae bacterium]